MLSLKTALAVSYEIIRIYFIITPIYASRRSKVETVPMFYFELLTLSGEFDVLDGRGVAPPTRGAATAPWAAVGPLQEPRQGRRRDVQNGIWGRTQIAPAFRARRVEVQEHVHATPHPESYVRFGTSMTAPLSLHLKQRYA